MPLSALVLMGAGLPLYWTPIANASLDAAGPHEQASGASIAIRELAIVVGVAVLASTFAALGGYTCATNFVAGFTPAMWVAVALSATGALVVFTLPFRPHPTREPTDATLQPTLRSDPDNLASAVASATSPPR